MRKLLVCCCPFVGRQPRGDVNHDVIHMPLTEDSKPESADQPVGGQEGGGRDGYLLAVLLDRMLFFVHLLATAILWAQLPKAQ